MFKSIMVKTILSGARSLHHAGIAQLPLMRTLSATIKTWVVQQSRDLPVPYFSMELDGYHLCIPYPLHSYYIINEFEPSIQNLLRKHLQPGMTVVDVGANIGYLSLLAARLVGPTGRVYAVEAAPDNLAFLKQNIKLNKIENIEVVPYAAGSQYRQRAFHLRSRGDLHGFYDHPMDEKIKTITVEEHPLDEVIRNKVDFVKIDVEGGEIEVLRGMRRILGSNPNIKLILEWFPEMLRRAGQSPVLLVETLEEMNFQLSLIEEERSVTEIITLLQKSQLNSEWRTNIYACPTHRTNQISL